MHLGLIVIAQLRRALRSRRSIGDTLASFAHLTSEAIEVTRAHGTRRLWAAQHKTDGRDCAET